MLFLMRTLRRTLARGANTVSDLPRLLWLRHKWCSLTGTPFPRNEEERKNALPAAIKMLTSTARTFLGRKRMKAIAWNHVGRVIEEMHRCPEGKRSSEKMNRAWQTYRTMEAQTLRAITDHRSCWMFLREIRVPVESRWENPEEFLQNIQIPASPKRRQAQDSLLRRRESLPALPQ